MTELLKRVLTASVMIGGLLPIYLFADYRLVLALFAGLMLLASREYAHMFGHKSFVFLYAAAMLLMFFIADAYFGIAMLLSAFSVIIRTIGILCVSPERLTINRLPVALLSLYDLSFFSVAAVRIFAYDKTILLWVILAIISVDTFGYFGGKYYGRHKAIPSVSPNKTWEGYIFGLLGAVLISFMFLIGHKISILVLTLVMLLVYLLAVIGDLSVSYLKRALSVKDTGTLLPGHGGVLDRLDSWMYVLPLIYLLIKVN